MGPDQARKTAGFFTFIVYNFIPVRKPVVIENLANAFPGYTEKKIRNIAYQCYRSFILAVMEILILKRFTREEIEKQVNVDNPELISEKYSEGKGVILLSAHLGNWEYVAASVSAQLNIPFHVIVKSQRNPYVNEWMNKVRTKWTNKVIPLGISVRQIYQELKKGNIVAMVADQRGPAEGIKLKFFGKMTSVFTGPAVLALKTGAPIIYGIAVRQPDFTYRTTLREISTDNLPESFDEKVKEITGRHIRYLEEVIRSCPEQWLWMHKRWKH